MSFPLLLGGEILFWHLLNQGGTAGAVLYDRALYPQAYGAVGDGVADDTAALQAWLDATVSLGRRGHLPAGTYAISAPLHVRGDGGALAGDGRRITKIKWSGPIDDGNAMVVWHRANGELDGIMLDGDYRASYGMIMHHGHGSAIRGLLVASMLHHGVILDNTLPDEAYGFNEGVIFYQLAVEGCGRYANLRVRTVGATGGTYTLTVDGFTTAPIAYNATPAQIATAIQAANLAAWTNPNGTNPFWQVAGTDAQTLAGASIRIYGILAGSTPVTTGNFTGLTGPVTTADVGYTQTGLAANGVHMYEPALGGADSGTVAFFEPQVRGNVGHGLLLIGQGMKIFGGHIEGNAGAGIWIGTSTGSASVDNLAIWPWLENNVAGGCVAEPTVGLSNRNLALLGSGFQPVENTNRGLTHLYPEGGGIIVAGRASGGVDLGRVAIDAASVKAYDPISQLSNLYAGTLVVDVIVYTHTSGGGHVIDCRRGTTHDIRLESNITALSFLNAVNSQKLSLRWEHNGGTFTVAWPAVRWAGGVAPTLGTGGAGSFDIIDLELRGSLWTEISRRLDI